jgi:hypothetical protein
VTPRKHLEKYLYRNGDDEVKYSYVQVVMCSLNFCLVGLTNYEYHLKILTRQDGHPGVIRDVLVREPPTPLSRGYDRVGLL